MLLYIWRTPLRLALLSAPVHGKVLARRLLLSLIACIGFGLLSTTPAHARDLSEYTIFLPFSSQLDREAVSQVAAYAFLARKWEVKSVSEESVVGYLNHRGIDATLELMILEDRILYFCDCTKGKTGPGAIKAAKRRIGWTPAKWLDNLRADIGSVLAAAAVAVKEGRAADIGSPSSIAERLQVLEGLLSQGLVSQQEYDTKRAEILSEL